MPTTSPRGSSARRQKTNSVRHLRVDSAMAASWTSVRQPVVYWGITRGTAQKLSEAHVHPDIEAAVILEGRQFIHYPDAVLECNPGDVWFAASGEIHGYTTEGMLSNACVAFSPDFLGDAMLGDRSWLSIYAEPPASRPRAVSQEQKSLLLAIGRQIHREATAQQPEWENAVRIHLLEMLLTVAREWTPNKRVVAHTTAPELSVLNPALQLVYARAPNGDKVSLGEAAAACAMSRFAFCRAFREATGSSFVEFSLRLRLSVALHLLRTTNLPVGQVAIRAGFWDRSHLHRHFVARYGTPPQTARSDISHPRR